eukprot:TRINITY_DN120164_c2_g1_i1.p1 TRINITY_DN120164_c2_g1~~TRINITY_DN120164_c2_g1_i1.p1  ORF type:complete len:560 (+),score=44.25 TRINITY_DN120164_c2_g1_i1:1545-3224(+)
MRATMEWMILSSAYQSFWQLESCKERSRARYCVLWVLQEWARPALASPLPSNVFDNPTSHRAVNRKFFRISVGGDRDTSTLKGFRRTYVGAIPGKIIQGLRNVQVENPVILIDEIDKLGERSVHGDPSSVLLEILDPEQNTNFTDDYVDIPVDLSKVLFLCTANTLNTIPKPLLDRMEIINVAGYTHAEKRHILNRYLLPQEMDRAGLTGKDKEFSITDDAKNEMIVNYCREPGVRGLQRSIKRIMERLALKMVTNEKDLTVSAKNLEDYIGNPPFHSARIYPQTPSVLFEKHHANFQQGVVCGLGWTELGGSILYIEAREFTVNREKIEHPGTGQVKITGSLGDVMKESVSIAHTLAKNFLNTYFPSHPASSYLDYHDIHVHIPEGGIPKEGPSAGVTLTTAFLSAALGQPVAQDVAMTGEVTLRGKVLAIGGVKEKVLAAQREGIKKVILPKKNEKDFMRLPEFLRKDIEVAYAEDYVDVFKIMFPDLLPQNQAKQEQRATIQCRQPLYNKQHQHNMRTNCCQLYTIVCISVICIERVKWSNNGSMNAQAQRNERLW